MLDLIEKKYLNQLPLILGALAVLAVTGVLAVAMLLVRWSRPDTAPINDGAVLVVFEGRGCDDCATFRRTIGRDYRASATGEIVPLRYYDASEGEPPPRHFSLSGRVSKGLNAVVFDVYGRESARWSGLPHSLEAFEAFVRPHVRKAQRDLAAAAANGHVN